MMAMFMVDRLMTSRRWLRELILAFAPIITVTTWATSQEAVYDNVEEARQMVGQRFDSPLETLTVHLAAFSVLNDLDFEIEGGNFEVVGERTEREELARLWVEHFAGLAPTPRGQQWVTPEFSQTEADALYEQILTRHLIPGSVFVELIWYLRGEQRTTYAIVKQDAVVGDLNGIIEPITGTLTSQQVRTAEHSFHMVFENGFGMRAAEYYCDASASCDSDGCVSCRGDVWAYDSRPLCSALARKSVEERDPCCVNHCSFVGYCGFPSVSFEATGPQAGGKFHVDGFGWQYYGAEPDIEACTRCDQDRQG